MAGRFVSLFFGTITLIPVFYLVKEAIGQKEAILSGLFYSFHAYLVTYSGMLLSEATYWGLLTLAVYFFWKGLSRKKVLGCMASGACLGLSYLTRPEGIGYLIVFLIWIIIHGGIRKGWFKKCVVMGSLIVGFFIFAFPYMFAIRQETGQWLVSKKGRPVQSELLNRVQEKMDPPSEVGNKAIKSAEVPKTEATSRRILEIVRNIIRYIPFTTYHYLRAYHFALWLFLFFGLVRVRQKGMKQELFLASLILFHLVSLSTFTGSSIRFSVPLIPISLFWAGAGVLEIQRYLQRVKISNPEKWVSFLIILFILIQLPQSLRPERRHRLDQKNVGLWLKENTPKDAVIMSNSPIEAFYAEREFVLLPIGLPMAGIPGKTYQEIIQVARKKKIRYILINKNTRELNPDFKESIRPTDLREFYRYQEKNGNITIVYEVTY
jgi:4-amino-4-deoxy-L-arabinose transferase-like glycosyltransferase